LYSVAELDPWVDRTRQIAAEAENTYVVTNNHNLGKAVVNALEIESMVTGELPEMPPDLVTHYPELNNLTVGDPSVR
jgi:uncharacterized protein YecE (DUF72 family)